MKRALALAAAALLMLSLSGCVLADIAAEVSGISYQEEEQETDVSFFVKNSASTAAASSPTPAPAQEEETLYDRILSSLESYETELVLTGYDPEDIAAAYDRVIAEHPEIFWATSGYKWSSVTSGSTVTVTFTPTLSGDTAEQTAAKKAQLDSVVSQVLAQISQTASDYEKALYIHDYLVSAVDYDQQEAALISSGYYQNAVPDCVTAYGALVNGSAVCSGYAKAFQLLAKELGLECIRVSGVGLGGGAHEWNAVALGGDWYHVDVTWDDPIYAGLSTSVLSHEFFGITTAELLLTHTIDDGQDIPDCTAVTYDYFRYNGLYFETYDRSALASMDLGTAFQIKFASASLLEQAAQDLFSGQGVFDLAPSWAGSVQYSQGTAGLVLTVEFS